MLPVVFSAMVAGAVLPSFLLGGDALNDKAMAQVGVIVKKTNPLSFARGALVF